MPENIFKQVSHNILKLHQQTTHSLLATRSCNHCKIHEAAYINLNGLYYVLIPQMPSENICQTGILLIENETLQSRLSWITAAREVTRKSSLYQRVISCLQHRLRQSSEKLVQENSDIKLLELTPQQGRLTTTNKDLSLSPHELTKALYPAASRLKEFSL